MYVTAIIAAAGRGERFGGSVPKQLVEVRGQTILERSVNAFLAHVDVADVVIALPEDLIERPPAYLKNASKPVTIVGGGARRQDSVSSAFRAVSTHADVVVIHDAARPFASADLISRTIAAAAEHGAALAALEARDTVKQVSDGMVAATLDRRTIFLAQTPQAFRRQVLRDALQITSDATDEAALAEQAGHRVRIVTGEAGNIKITTQEDLALAEAITRSAEASRSDSRDVERDRSMERDGFSRAFSRAIPQLVLALVAIWMLTATGPTAAWRHQPIGAGRVPVATLTSPNKWEEFARMRRRSIVWEGDGIESSVALAHDADGYAFIVNGKPDGSAIADAGTQVMLGMIGPILNPAAKRTLVIGLGTGSSAGWIAAIPSMERVDVVELEPLIVDIAKACVDVNHDVLNNPKIRLTIGDAREWLLETRERYDIIASEPSNPFRAGVASLFTRDYYRAADARLTPDGLFLQWVQAYEVDARTIQTVYKTMASVFPHVETWQTSSGDIVLIGARHAVPYSMQTIANTIRQEPFATALRATWHTTNPIGFFSHYVGGAALTRAIAESPDIELNEDDRNVVEFGFARTVGRTWATIIVDLKDAARQLGVSEPVVDGQRLDPSVLRTALVSYYTASGWGNDIPTEGTEAERSRQRALKDFYTRGDLAAAKTELQTQTNGPRDPAELAMLAVIEADSGSDAVRPLIERIRTYEPAEADAILAMLVGRQNKLDETAAALESAFKQMTRDPWPLMVVKRRALSLAENLGLRSPALAQRMIAALGQPFAAGAMPDERLRVAANLSRVAGLAQTCGNIMHALEPHSPWDPPMLTLRRDCYASTADPLLSKAERELREYADLEGQGLILPQR
jgi:2-C-methyl-D-erythritol 4-phosphate cytidylyltransferase